MFVNLTTQEIIDANQSCKVLLAKPFLAKTAFKIASLSKKLSIIEQTFNEIKTDTIKKYGQKDEKGNIITETLEDGQIYIPIVPEFQKKCSDEILEALQQRFDINYSPLAIEDLEDKELTPETLMNLYHFIINEEEEGY